MVYFGSLIFPLHGCVSKVSKNSVSRGPPVYCFHLNVIFSGFSAAFVVIDDADNFDYTPFESAAPLRNNYERKPPRQKAL